MELIQTAPESAKGSIAYFFRQTFRRHTRAEYSELLTRGVRGAGGVNRKYPWSYIRLFTLFFVLFAIYLLIVRFTSEELFAPTITVLAAVCFNLPFLLLLYELYPQKDLSFIAVLFALLIGGSSSHIVSQILFNIFPPKTPWLRAVYSGLFEEIPKAVATIIAILIAGKRSPLAGFIMGAAVGCGFSIVEDMGYIFLQSNDLPVYNLPQVITLSLARGSSSLCTHTLWTAVIGWAFNNPKKFLANISLFLVTVLSCGLHIAWDLPLANLANILVCVGCAVVIVTMSALILYSGRKKVYRSAVEQVDAQSPPFYKEDNDKRYFYYEEDGAALSKFNPRYWSHWGRFTLVFAAFLMAVCAVIYCAVPATEKYGTETFYSSETFVSFMQDGMDLDADKVRPYNDHGENINVVEVDGRVIRLTQTETDTETGYKYYYTYTASYDEVTGKAHYFPSTVEVEITKDGGVTVTYPKEVVYASDGTIYASYFRVTKQEVVDFVFGEEYGVGNDSIIVFIYDAGFTRDLGSIKYLPLFIIFAAVTGIAAICYVSLRIKSWRVKRQCMIKNVFFAE